jgi:hypothetical protein
MHYQSVDKDVELRYALLYKGVKVLIVHRICIFYFCTSDPGINILEILLVVQVIASYIVVYNPNSLIFSLMLLFVRQHA